MCESKLSFFLIQFLPSTSVMQTRLMRNPTLNFRAPTLVSLLSFVFANLFAHLFTKIKNFYSHLQSTMPAPSSSLAAATRSTSPLRTQSTHVSPFTSAPFKCAGRCSISAERPWTSFQCQCPIVACALRLIWGLANLRCWRRKLSAMGCGILLTFCGLGKR